MFGFPEQYLNECFIKKKLGLCKNCLKFIKMALV